jgi:hypothetical protein
VATCFQAGISVPLRPSLTAANSATRLKRARGGLDEVARLRVDEVGAWAGAVITAR